MDDRQTPIAAWMRNVIERHGISARAWAESASLGKDTVSRAIRDDYANVTSTRTLASLADAIGERPPGVAGAIPSVESCEGIVKIIADLASRQRMGEDAVRELSAALRETLLALADEPSGANDPAVSRLLLRSAIRRNGSPSLTH